MARVAILNVHERLIPAPADEVGRLLDSLSGPDDGLWPGSSWPPLRLKPGLEVGALGGHGPVRYGVSRYEPGSRVEFIFDPHAGIARGFYGQHLFEIEPRDGHCLLRHVIEAECTLPAWLRWAVAIRWLHDALLEDALDRAESRFASEPLPPRSHSPWVRLLRRLARPRRAPEQKP